MTSTVKSAARWLWDHKKLVVGTSLAAAGAYAGYVMYQKKRELDALCEELMGQVSTTSRSEESRAREHFDLTQQEVNAVLAREMPKVQAQLKRLLDTEALTQELRKDGQKFDQAQWSELKLMVWTRLLSSVYALALLQLKLRIHINIVARHTLHEISAAHAAAGADAAPAAAGLTGATRGGGGGGELSKLTKLRFLAMEPLSSEGFEPLVREVRAAVEAELGAVSLDQKLTLPQLTSVLDAVRARLERDAAATRAGAPAESAPVRAFLLESLEGVGAVASGDQLAALLAEAREILQSEPYRVMLADVLGAAHGALRALLQQKLEGAANGGPPASNGSAADKNGSSARDGSAASHGAEGAGAPPPSTPMAKMLPRVSRLVPTITAEDVGANPIAAAIAQVPALDEFSWMVYTAGPLFSH